MILDGRPVGLVSAGVARDRHRHAHHNPYDADVYFETVPSAADLQRPASLTTMKPEAPPADVLAPVPLAAPVLTDEELARQLQASFDEEGS